MPSPFPGMDPWLEAPDVFPDLHESLMFLMKEALNASLPEGYFATSKNRVWVEEEQLREPDVSLYGNSGSLPHTGVAALAGMVIVDTGDPVEETYLEVLSARGRKLVTAIEIISHANKRAGEMGRETYISKQIEYRRAGVNLVEIDLLRRGPHVSAVSEARVRRTFGKYDYLVSVCTARDGKHHAAPILLENRLPAFGVPLDADAAPVTLDLQPLMDRAYDSGRYRGMIDYSRPADPRLPPKHEAWAEAILRAKGLLPAIPVPNP